MYSCVRWAPGARRWRPPRGGGTGIRTSTIHANVPEPFFQTLERHWETVVERVAAFVDTRVHRTRP
jgi:hypothetical protein